MSLRHLLELFCSNSVILYHSGKYIDDSNENIEADKVIFLFYIRFNKIRVDPSSGLIHRDDFQYAKSEGNPVRFGRAGDCFSAASKCQKGKFQVDLSGTGLRMRKDVDWEAWGTPKMPQRLLNIHKAEDGTMAYGECGGSCGGCQPVKEKMFVEPSTCTDPTSTGKYANAPWVEEIFPPWSNTIICEVLGFNFTVFDFLFVTLVEAVARQSIPAPSAKTDQKGEKKSVVKLPQKVHVRSEAPYPHLKKFFSAGPGLDQTEMEVVGHVTKKKKRSESKKKKKRKRHLSE